MNEAIPVAGKLIPPLKRSLRHSKGPQQTPPQETELTPANHDKSPPKRKKPLSTSSNLESADVFEVTTAGASREVSMLFSKFAEVLSDRAAADTSQMKELEGILAEARNLEFCLKEKKKHLRQTLALISDKLQG